MSRSIVTIMRDPGRIAAKAILAATIGLLAVLLATTSFGDALAQVGGDPQPPSSGPAIQFVNPEKTTSLMLSDKNDGSNETYHLNAWTAGAPATAVVEFEITRTTGSPTANFIANRLGNDTWEYFWAIPSSFPEGTYTAKATLFNQAGAGGTVLAQDQETVVINQAGPAVGDVTPAGETVEITYPINAGPLGVKRVPGNQAANFVMRGTASSGTTYVAGYYSVSPAGHEPEFKGCQTSGGAAPRFQSVGTSAPPSSSTRSFSYRCLVPAADAGSAITAVALVANDTPRAGVPADPPAEHPDNTDSGDGHRTFSYSQTPTTLELEPSHTDRANVDNCVTLRAKVLDQFGQPIAGQNVDVHAAGPTDQLRFDTATQTTDANQAPNSGPHTPDTAWNCNTSTAVADRQGEHNIAGANDIKHIESFVAADGLQQANGGTSNDGVFRFQLKTDAPGTTQVSAWADTADDDVWAGPGTNEPCGNASIGWGDFAAPTPTGASPEFSGCRVMPRTAPSPTPTTTATATPTPTPTTTGTATPTPTATATGTPTPTATGTATATPTPTATTTSPPPGARCPGNESDPRNHVVGTPGDDQLNGTSGNDIICGLGGDDVINGLGGHDVLLGGDGNDTINGDAGNDQISGGNGDDTIDGGDGNDDIDGGDGKDSIVGGNGDDEIRGGPQNDVILGNAGNDTLVGGSGFDVIRGGRDHDTIKGGPGRDTLRGFTGNDIIRGGSGEDTLSGGRGADFLKGGKDDDLLKGGRGHDELHGGGGLDTCDGGPGRNIFVSCEKRAR